MGLGEGQEHSRSPFKCITCIMFRRGRNVWRCGIGATKRNHVGGTRPHGTHVRASSRWMDGGIKKDGR
jgi:hypothetical protein